MKVLIADDHALFRDGLALQIAELDNNVVIAEAGDFNELLKIAGEQENIDLILVDLRMPGMDWREAIAKLLDRLPGVPIVDVSASSEYGQIMKMIEAGIAGFIPKSSSGKVMISALKLVFSGGTYLPPELLSTMRMERKKSWPPKNLGIQADIRTVLTPRQLDVLEKLGEGSSNKVIARFLDLSEGTVKLHVHGILKALNASNRTQAVLTAARLGLISPP